MKSVRCSQRKRDHHSASGGNAKVAEVSEGNGFKIPPDIDEDEFSTRFWKELKEERALNRRGGYAKNQNYSSRQRLNLAERLHVPEHAGLPGKSITDDIDRDYFTLVSGRRIKMDKNIREYLKDIRSCFLARLKIGYWDDEVVRAEREYQSESKNLRRIKRKFDMCLNCFEEFLKEDHSSSLGLLKLADKEKKISEEKKILAGDLADCLRRHEAELLMVEEKWSTYKSYQKFLCNISPSEWRREHDDDFRAENNAVGLSAGGTRATDSEDGDLMDKIDKFVEESGTRRPPALYFTDPEQVQAIFRELEKTNVIALIHCDNLEKPIQRMISALNAVKAEFEKREVSLAEDIAFLKALVDEEERKVESLRQTARTSVFETYRQFVVNEENLKVIALIEDAYEDAIAGNDYELTMVDMVKELGNKFENLMLSLDLHSYKVLVPALKSFYRDERRVEAEAKDAERKVHQMNILLKRLSKSLEYPKKGFQRSTTRKLVHRSEPRKEALEKYEHLKLTTEGEKEREYFFGRTCRNVGEAGLCRPLCLISNNTSSGLPK